MIPLEFWQLLEETCMFLSNINFFLDADLLRFLKFTCANVLQLILENVFLPGWHMSGISVPANRCSSFKGIQSG
jgi:hypothetical protein